MMNSALREARLHRITSFMHDVTKLYTAMTAGKPVKSKISKLRNYSLSFTAAKSDEMLRPLAVVCEQLLDELTDGKPYDQVKSDRIDSLLAQAMKEAEKGVL